MLEDRQPQFDNEFMSIIERQTDQGTSKVSLVFTSTVKNENMDAVSMLNISSKLLDGLRHFATQPTISDIMDQQRRIVEEEKK